MCAPAYLSQRFGSRSICSDVSRSRDDDNSPPISSQSERASSGLTAPDAAALAWRGVAWRGAGDGGSPVQPSPPASRLLLRSASGDTCLAHITSGDRSTSAGEEVAGGGGGLTAPIVITATLAGLTLAWRGVAWRGVGTGCGCIFPRQMKTVDVMHSFDRSLKRRGTCYYSLLSCLVCGRF